jgi:hypothetical protein
MNGQGEFFWPDGKKYIGNNKHLILGNFKDD